MESNLLILLEYLTFLSIYFSFDKDLELKKNVYLINKFKKLGT